VMQATSVHPNSHVIAETGISIVCFLTRFKTVQNAVPNACTGNIVINNVINSMSQHILDNDVQLSGCKALYNLPIQHEPSGIAIVQAWGLARISNAMQKDPANARSVHELVFGLLLIVVFSSQDMSVGESVIRCSIRAMHLHAVDNNLQVRMFCVFLLEHKLMQSRSPKSCLDTSLSYNSFFGRTRSQWHRFLYYHYTFGRSKRIRHF